MGSSAIKAGRSEGFLLPYFYQFDSHYPIINYLTHNNILNRQMAEPSNYQLGHVENSITSNICYKNIYILIVKKKILHKPYLGGFQLLDLILMELKSHMTCYNSMPLIGWNHSIQTWEQICKTVSFFLSPLTCVNYIPIKKLGCKNQYSVFCKVH